MTKSLEEYFIDWESHVFGFGYGTGESHVLSALKGFFNILKQDRNYDHRILEKEFGPIAAWLLINVLAHADIIEYGTSPRFGWLTTKGERLRDFVGSKTSDELVDIVCHNNSECTPDNCYCDPDNPNDKCLNPFWSK